MQEFGLIIQKNMVGSPYPHRKKVERTIDRILRDYKDAVIVVSKDEPIYKELTEFFAVYKLPNGSFYLDYFELMNTQ